MEHHSQARDDDWFDPLPTALSVVSASAAAFGAFGIMHLILAAVFECLQTVNLALGLLEILIAILIAFAVYRWRKQHDRWRKERRNEISPPASAGP